LHRRSPIALAALAAIAALVGFAPATGAAAVTLPDTAMGKQLAWVIGEINGGSSTLVRAEVERHVTARFLVGLPATDLIDAARQATSAYAPVRFTGFAGRPSATSAIALIETRTHQKLAVYASIDDRSQRLAALDIAAPPQPGAVTMATASRYTGTFPVGGRRKMFITCAGSGSPTVILEAGAGGGVYSWSAVQPSLTTTTRVCSYDRANLPGGSSDPAPKPQTAADIVTDLHKLLTAARIPGPYVFVGHSNGGLFARLYATTYPQEVNGLVLIDTGNYPDVLNRVYRQLLTPQRWRVYAAAQNQQPRFVENPADEQVDLATSYRQLEQAQRRRPLRKLPLVVISHGIPEPAMGKELVPGVNAAIEREWQKRQIELAALVPGGRRIVATNTGHMIPSERPALVVGVIKDMLRQLSARSPVSVAKPQPPVDKRIADRSRGFAERLDEERWLAAFEVPGAAVALVRDGRPTWAKGYGRADIAGGVPVTPDTVFEVGSISKSVTAWGVMRLVQQGKLELNAPVEQYLTRWHLPRSPFDAQGVTIGRLLSHSAGLNSQDYSPISRRPLPSLEESLSGDSGGANARSGTDDVRITMQPGRQWNYSNGGYTLLQLAIEEVTDEPFARYMQREILDPLGMARSSFAWENGAQTTSATGYDDAGRPVPRTTLTELAAGGLHTTANDIAAFMAAGMTGPNDEPAGRGVLTPDNVAALFARHRLPDGSTTSLGYEVQTLPDGTHAAGHGGKNTGWRAEFLTLPDRREGIVVLTNSNRLDGIVGLTEQAWGDWLGTGPPMISRMEQGTLQPLYTLLLVIAGTLLIASSICLALAWRRRPRTRRRQWIWRGPSRPGAGGWIMRGITVAAALTAAGTWALLPVRDELASVTPARVTLVTSALLLFCAVVAITALTRRLTSGASDREPASEQGTPAQAT
jgi:CubicO group peptidase (beta-lactamase class C family)/pimeloyl-ACP methyl ester carboxylesterase